MAFIGNQPAESFTSFATQEFSTSATTSYTLDHAVTNENEIALFINNVRQQPGSGKAYTATGTALTLSEATASTDTMYCVFLGRALQTVTPATNSITAAMVGNDLISGKDALTSSPDTTDEIILSDAGTLKRADISVLGNAPAFKAKSASSQSVSNSSNNLVVLGTEVFDTDNAFSSNRFTVPSGEGGKYFFSAGVGSNSSIDDGKKFIVKLHKNGSEVLDGYTRIKSPTANSSLAITLSAILDLSATDYIELNFYTDNSDSGVEIGGDAKTFLSGFKLIGI